MESCVFCKIIRKELEGSFVFEGEFCSAFLDLHPINPGHVLIVPKKHHERFTEIEPEVVSEIFKTAQRILKAIEASDLKCDGANIFLSDGTLAGQEVPHSHLHIVPRFKGDGQRMGFSQSDSDLMSRLELRSIADLLRRSIVGL